GKPGVIFQRVEPAIHREGRVLEIVAEPHSLGLQRTEAAERGHLAHPAKAEAQFAALSADEPAGRSTFLAVETRKVAIGARALAQIAAEPEGPVRLRIRHGCNLGMRIRGAQTKRRDDK